MVVRGNAAIYSNQVGHLKGHATFNQPTKWDFKFCIMSAVSQSSVEGKAVSLKWEKKILSGSLTC